MDLVESFRIGWRAITGHKLRSSLTTLGVIIGIGSVIVFMVMGGGFMADAVADVDAETQPELSVQTQTSPEAGFGWQLDTTPIYTEHDIEQLESIDGVDYAAPDGWLSAAQLSSGENQLTGNFNARATVPEYLADRTGIEGEIFDEEDEAVLNEEAVAALEFPDAPGEQITVTFEDGREASLTVTGVVDDGDSGWNAQPTVYLPVEPHYSITVQTPRESTERAYPFVNVRAEDTEILGDVQEQSRAYLQSESDAVGLKQDGHDIRVLTQEDQLERFEELIDQITLFVAAVAGISLFVGSVGIANIMIVSVAERRREIGIMKAVGASKRDVVQLFLAESLILGIVGAVFGVAAGLAIGYLAVAVAGWPMTYPLRWIGVAVLVGIIVGIVSGLYPAWRGAKIDPIAALRHD